MIEIQVNAKAQKAAVKAAYNTAKAKIIANAKAGNNTTELLIDKNISMDVRDMLTANIKNINFLIVYTRPNPYTGRMDNFTSRTEGNSRFFKVRI